MKKFFLKLSVIALLISLLTACQNSKGWVYRSNDYDGQNLQKGFSLKSKKLKVLPLQDRRSNENKNMLMLYMVPFMPFGWQEFDSPESVQMHINSGLWLNYNPKEDYSKAIVEDLRSADLFKDVEFSYSKSGSDYHINGQLISTDYEGKIITYGLSVYGPLLWYIGFPASQVSNDLSIKLSLVNTKNKEVVYSKTYNASRYKKLGWIYNLPSDFNYSEMLREINREFVEDIARKFR